jgi:hypothetical protein
MQTYFPPQRIVRGVLAGLTAMFVCLLTLLVAQLPVLFWIVLYNLASGLPADELWGEVAQNLARLPSFLWGFRWGFLIIGSVGLPLALTDCLARRLPYPWVGSVSLVVLLGLTTAIGVTTIYLTRVWTLTALLQPSAPLALLLQQPPLQLADSTLLVMVTFAAVLVAISLHSVWMWWDRWWDRWLTRHNRQPPLPTTIQPPPRSGGTAFPRRSLLPGLGLALVGATLMVGVTVVFYHTAHAELGGGTVTVSAATRRATAFLRVPRAPQRVWIVSSIGHGMIDITVTQPETGAALSAMHARPLPMLPPLELATDGWPVGPYQLIVQLQNGAGGSLRYGYLVTASRWAILSAGLAGLSVGLLISLAALLILEGLAQWVWTEDPQQPS